MKTLKDKIIESLSCGDLGYKLLPQEYMNYIKDFYYNETTHPYYQYYINEGLIWSYDPFFTRKQIIGSFGIKEKDIKVLGLFDVRKYSKYYNNEDDVDKDELGLNDKKQDAHIKVLYNTLEENELSAAFRICGYALHSKEKSKINKDKTIFDYYPKYQKKVNNYIIKNNKILYHYSLKKYENRIKKYGLIPRSNNDEYEYPDSIFLFKENTHDIDKTVLLKQRFKEELNDLIEIKVDVSKLQKDIDFYIDPDKSNYSIFTYDNISPECLSIKNYKINI